MIKTYSKIMKKLDKVGFDEFYQAGTPSKFHPLNIVATSKATNKQYWICVDGGYRCSKSFHIAYRDLDDTRADSVRIQCKNQTEICKQLDIIENEIKG